MSHYQQYLRAIQGSDKTPSPSSSANRKPVDYSTPPKAGAPYSPPSVHTSVTQAATPGTKSAPHTPASTTPSNVAPAAQSTPNFIPIQSSSSITHPQLSSALTACLTLQTTAVSHHSKRPFAALLLAPDAHTILLTHFSISHVQHAETELARLASLHFSQEYLRGCTLVSTWEPCAMCSGTIYWSGIGRIVYAASEKRLKELTGDGNGENLTMGLPCRTVFESGQRDVEVIGPVTDGGWEDRVVEESRKWWREHNGGEAVTNGNGTEATNSRNGSVTATEPDRKSLVTTWTGEESVLSSIGEDGEYKADLDIDWMR